MAPPVRLKLALYRGCHFPAEAAAYIIGSPLAKELRERGHEVKLVGLKPSGSPLRKSAVGSLETIDDLFDAISWTRHAKLTIATLQRKGFTTYCLHNTNVENLRNPIVLKHGNPEHRGSQFTAA